MIWLYVLGAAFGGYWFGKNQATLTSVVQNRSKIEGAATAIGGVQDVVTGVQRIFQ